MLSPGLPMLFVVSLANFLIIYWVDKWLVLRFYRTPRNYDEKTIKFTLSSMKWAFLFHSLVGFLMISNDKILTS